MDNPKTRRPRRTNKDLRNDILNAASEVIKNEGFAKSSLMRIVNLAKVESTVFHRHFGDWKEFMDIYTRKYDYWFSDVIDSIEKNQCTEKEFRSIMHGLFDDLNSNIIMQELLKWEICDENTITKRTAQMREFNTMPLVRRFQRVFAESDVKIGSLSALLIGGVYYLILHKKLSPFSGIDVNNRDGQEEIHYAIDFFTDVIFNRIKERGIEDRIAKRLRLNGVSEDIIKDSVYLCNN